MKNCAFVLVSMFLSLSVRGAPIVGSFSDGQGNGYAFTGVNTGNNSTLDFSAHSPFLGSFLELVVYTDPSDSSMLYLSPDYRANTDASAKVVSAAPVSQSGAPNFPAGMSYTSTLSANKGTDGSFVVDYGNIHMDLTGMTLIDSSGMTVSDYVTIFGQNRREWNNVFHVQMQAPLPGVFHTFDADIVATPEPSTCVLIFGCSIVLSRRHQRRIARS